MVHNEALSTTFASLGAVLWSVQLIPQIYLNHKRQCTEGFSGLMMCIWVSAGTPLAIYNIVQDLNIGLKIQPELFSLFALICTLQTFHYRLAWTYLKSGAIMACCVAANAGLQVAGIELCRLGQRHGVTWPITTIGVLSAILINVGLLPQYWEIYRLNAVVGLSWIFLGMDFMGAVTSFLSLPFDKWDILAAVSYGILMVEEGGLFLIGAAFWIRDRRAKKARAAREKSAAIALDEITTLDGDHESEVARMQRRTKSLEKGAQQMSL